MIRSLSASNSAFTTIHFRDGFNVVLADRDPAATDQQSRNARGKTSLLLVLNYMLGGSLPTNLRELADDGWSFTLTLDMFGGQISVTRSLSAGARLGVTYPAELENALSGYVRESSISLDDWKELLGLAMFRLEPIEEQSESLSVRTLLSYVVRSSPPSDPLKFFPNQPAISVRKHISFLLGLDWNVVRELQIVNRKLDGLQAVVRAVGEGDIEALRPADELELERSVAQNALDALVNRVGEFRVLEDPDGLVGRADTLTTEIGALRDSAFVDQQMESLYVDATRDDLAEVEADESRTAAIYEAAGVVFAEAARRRLSQVESFRRNLFSNRRQFLEAELTAVQARLVDTRAQLRELDLQREQVMSTLRTGGALDELISLQSEVAELGSRVKIIDSRIEQIRDVSVAVDALKLDKAQLRNDASIRLTQDRSKVDAVSDRFRAKMKRLYDADAAISVTVDDDGYQFAVSVAGGASSAVSRMKLFCFDLTLLEEGATTGHHPDFLVHDSSVFDGVDPRQRASALEFAQTTAVAVGGQYICTLNSNDVPEDVALEEWFSRGIIRNVLDTDDGGLFGVTF